MAILRPCNAWIQAWVFHVSPDGRTSPDGKTPLGGDSAIWAAQRVPDDAVAVVDNMYVIRELNLSDTQHFLGSKSVHTVAEEQGLWNRSSGKLLDFAGVYSHGEYGHKYYSGRRMWGSFRRLAPETALSPTYGNLKTDNPHPYPFSVAPVRKLNASDIMAVMRDHYEGTKYSSANGLAAGAWGNPNRYGGGTFPNGTGVEGAWERTISIHRSTYTTVVQARAYLPDTIGGTIWFGPHAAHGTCYVPFPCGMPSLPHRYTIGWQAVKDQSALWAFRFVENLAQMRFNPMMQDIKATQQHFERLGFAVQASWAQHYRGSNSTEQPNLNALVWNSSVNHANTMLDAWWQLGDTLMMKHAQPAAPGVGVSVSYPSWWLEAVGFPQGPPPPLEDEEEEVAAAEGKGDGQQQQEGEKQTVEALKAQVAALTKELDLLKSKLKGGARQ